MRYLLSFLVLISSSTAFSQKSLEVSLDAEIFLELVFIDSLSIWMGKYEVTNQQYQKFMRFRDGSQIIGQFLNDPDQPAVFVSYCDVEGFLYWINGNVGLPDGYTARLMTGQEWDYIIGDKKYPWGDSWPPTFGNFFDETGNDSLGWERQISGYRDGFAVSASVYNTKSNQFGVHGISGNVREWTKEENNEGWKFIRGGSWRDSKKENLESKYKVAGAPWGKDNHIGFRIVLSKN